MRPRCVLGVLLVGVCGSSAFGLGETMIADFEWGETWAFAATGPADPPPPINLTTVDFRITDTQNTSSSSHSLGDQALILASGETGAVDLNLATDPDAFHFFADLFTIDPAGEVVWLSIGLGPGFSQFFGDASFGDPTLVARFSPAELTALQGAEVAFFRITVESLTIENGVGGVEWRGDVVSSGRVEVFIPSPGGSLVLALAGIPLAMRRRR